MGILKKLKLLSYFTLILLLVFLFILPACKKKQSQPAQDQTQDDIDNFSEDDDGGSAFGFSSSRTGSTSVPSQIHVQDQRFGNERGLTH